MKLTFSFKLASFETTIFLNLTKVSQFILLYSLFGFKSKINKILLLISGVLYLNTSKYYLKIFKYINRPLRKFKI